MGRRNVLGLWAATALLLVGSVVGYALEADEADPTGVRMVGAASDGDGSSGDDYPEPQIVRPPETRHAIISDAELPPAFRDGVTVPPDAFVIPEPVEPPFEMPRPETREPMPPPGPGHQPPSAPSYAKPGDPGPATKDGSDCGTPWGYGGYGAERSTTAGTAKATVQAYHCHSYEGEHVQNFAVFESPDAVAVDVDFDYGDGKTHDGPSGGWSCSDSNRGRPSHTSGPPHYYSSTGKHTITATVTYTPCNADGTVGPAQKLTVSIDVFQHAGRRPS